MPWISHWHSQIGWWLFTHELWDVLVLFTLNIHLMWPKMGSVMLEGRAWTSNYIPGTVACHYTDVIMTTMASQITSLTVVYSIVYSSANQKNIKAPCHWPLCGEFTGTGEFPAQRASNAEDVSIWWRHHIITCRRLWYLLLAQHSW